MPIPSEKQHLLDFIVSRLIQIPGIQAVVLGGSYARGTEHAGSDLDMGLYYMPDQPLSIAAVRDLAGELSIHGEPVVTGFYEWGQWVNGGAWIHTTAGKVDFLYRNIDQVRQTIKDAQAGQIAHDFNQQPAYGFYSVIYLAETHICRPLYDPHRILDELKAQVREYPPLLKEKTIAGSLWMAEFSLLHARGYAAQGNGYAVIGSLTRAAAFLTQVLFALNETYFMSDKTAMREVATFCLVPTGYVDRLAGILAHPGRSAAELEQSTQMLFDLWAEVVALTGGSYQPAFRL